MVFSKRQQQPPQDADENTDWGKVGSVLIVFSLVSFITAWVFSFESQTISSPDIYSHESGQSSLIGPIIAKKNHETYQIRVKALNMPMQSWAYVEGQVLDSNKSYLFSFGKGLWNESGRDSEGYYWQEADDSYEISINLPKRGTYYLQFNAESNQQPEIISLIVVKKWGSSLPHLWFGVILLLLGIVLNEMQNRTVTKVLGKFSND